MGSATGTVGGLGQRRFESQDQSAPTSTTTWQQEALRVRASCEWGRGAQGKDSLHDPPYLGIGRNQTFRVQFAEGDMERPLLDRKSTRLNSSHSQISYAVFCLKKKKKIQYVTCSAEHT